MSEKLYPPVHPGEILLEDFIEGFEITQHCSEVGLPANRGHVVELPDG